MGWNNNSWIRLLWFHKLRLQESERGKTLPRTSSSQYSSSKKVSVSSVQPGDLVFFSHGSGIQHVGIATSKSSMVNSETGGVKYSSFKSGYWGSRLVGAGSYL
ncbi:NlpC/P60 family protein [Exiguobacterium sp. SL14]|nr:NlpC/P60 family protein [Exiguobacterium sp. SL14]MCY1689787.1 NlpC/P60 family protein [Exiguobacterium sp. SL14]